MKKIVILLLVFGVVTGCNKKTTGLKKEDEVRAKLMEVAHSIFEVEAWQSGGIEPNVHVITLNNIKNDLKRDVSYFSDNKCDFDKTKIIYTVLKQLVPDKTNGEYKLIIDCKFE